MAKIATRPNGQWRARYRDTHGVEHAAEINPRPVSSEHRYLTHEQVDARAAACTTPPAERNKHGPKSETWNDDYRLVVLFLAYTGCRWGEMAALRVGTDDFLRRRTRVVAALTLVRGVQTWGDAVLTRATASIGLDRFHPHELRHTAASLAIASGADVKLVQQMLGHKSATMTLDPYGHLFEHRLDEVATAMDTARSRGLLADSLRAHGELITMPTNARKH